MKKKWTPIKLTFFASAIVGIFFGFILMMTQPREWIWGAAVFAAGLSYALFALLSGEKVPEEHEKPVMDVATRLQSKSALILA